MTTERRQFSPEFKREAVRLAKERDNLAQVARELGISDTVLQRWKKALQEAPANPFPGQGNAQDAEAAALRRENVRLREENEILKKAVGIFTKAPSETRSRVGGEVPVYPAVTGAVHRGRVVPGHAGLAKRLLRLERTAAKPAR